MNCNVINQSKSQITIFSPFFPKVLLKCCPKITAMRPLQEGGRWERSDFLTFFLLGAQSVLREITETSEVSLLHFPTSPSANLSH